MITSFQKRISQERYVLPPLSGYTDYPYRCILSSFQPAFICTEMVNATALINNNKKTVDMLTMEPGDHLKGVQLVGNNPIEMKKAASIVETLGYDYIDVNMGCTVKKVVQKGQGVALMQDEELAALVVKEISSSVNIPVTVKIRSGISESMKNAISLSKKLERAGAQAISVHGRSGEKKFGSFVDYDIIKQVTSSVDIPVIANGGITEDNYQMVLQRTNADAVMPGRILIGNPWIISQIKMMNNGSEYVSPSLFDRIAIVEKHLHIQCEFYGERDGVRQFRSVLPRYFRYCHQLNRLKDDAGKIHMITDVENILQRLSEIDTIIWYL